MNDIVPRALQPSGIQFKSVISAILDPATAGKLTRLKEHICETESTKLNARWYPNYCCPHVDGMQVQTLNSAIPESEVAPGTHAVTEISVTGEKSDCAVSWYHCTRQTNIQQTWAQVASDCLLVSESHGGKIQY